MALGPAVDAGLVRRLDATFVELWAAPGLSMGMQVTSIDPPRGVVDTIARHRTSEQALVAVGPGAFFVLVAPPGWSVDDHRTPDAVAVDVGSGLIIPAATWHSEPFGLGRTASIVNIQATNYEDDTQVHSVVPAVDVRSLVWSSTVEDIST